MSPATKTKFKNPRARYNFQGRTCSISGVGSYLPSKVLTNGDLEKMVDTSDEWITSRTGIKERRLAAQDEFTSDLATQAALKAMTNAGITAEQIDLIHCDHYPRHAVPFDGVSRPTQNRRGARGGI